MPINNYLQIHQQNVLINQQ